MSDVEEPPKRGRGRPAGSLNRSTLAKRAAAEAAAAVDESVSDTVPEMPLEAIVEEADDEAAPAAKPKRASRKKADDLRSAAEPHPPEPETVPEPEPVPQPPQAPRIPDRMPAKPKHAPRKPRVLPALPAAPRPAVGGKAAPLLHEASLLDIMRAGLEHARTKHKRDRVAQYDAMFAY